MHMINQRREQNDLQRTGRGGGDAGGREMGGRG